MPRVLPLLLVQLAFTSATTFAQINCPLNLPYYPPLARQARIEGVVKVEFDIAKDGTVTKAIAKSGHPILRIASVNIVSVWKFQPANDVRQEAIEFHYKLGKEGESRCTQVRINLPIIEVIQSPPVISID